MDREQAIRRISGCYIPMPTLFTDGSLEVNLAGMRRHARHLVDGGVKEGNGVLLVCGGAGEFASLSTDERLKVLDAVLAEVGGRVGVVLGVQGTIQSDVLALVRAAHAAGAVAVQAAVPFYHVPTPDDAFEWFAAMAQAADIPMILYTTYWTGFHTKLDFLGRLAELPQMVAIKWATPNQVEFERGIREFHRRFLFIDNSLQFVVSHILGARGVNTHPSNYWPAWGVKLWGLLEAGEYRVAQEEMAKVISPYYEMHHEVGRWTGGEGHLDKLCLELVGLDSSRCRPPIRDIREQFRPRVREMLKACHVPGVR